MKQTLNTYLNLSFRVGVLLVILSTLFLFTNLFTDFYDTPKFLLLLVFVGAVLLLLTGKFTLDGKVVFVRTPLDLPLLLLLLVAVASTLLSSSPHVSFLGNQARVHGSLISWIVYILFYFLVVNNLKSLKDIRWLIFLILGSSTVLAVLSLLVYFGVKVLPPPWAHGVNFTPTGSSFSTAAVLAMLLPIVCIKIISERGLVQKGLYGAMLTLFGVTLVLIGSLPLWIAALAGMGAVLFLTRPHLKDLNLLSLGIPLVLVSFVVLLSFVPPIGKAQNPFYSRAQNFPREVQLAFIPSWKIAVSSFRDSPLPGSGPATFLFDFTLYKPIEFNQTKFWNLRFDSAFNEYLGVLATLGGVGLLALILATVMFLSFTYRVLMSESRNEENATQITSLAISGLVFFVILALHASSLVLWVVGLLILAAFSATAHLSQQSSRQTSLQGANFREILSRIALSSYGAEEQVRIDALPSVLLTTALVAVLGVGFFGSKFVLADYHHRLALNAVSQNQGILAYNELILAEKLNPNNDLYRTDLAQTNFALANAIAQAKAPTEASPAGSLTDQDKQNIQILLQQSIDEARAATTLSPKNVVNWEILASLYRQISGVAQNALVFALDSYGRAVFLDPLNPVLRINVGGTYLAVKNYDLAIRFFTDSINLKPDFANGFFNLSVALRDKGDLQGAAVAAQRILDLVDKDSQDFKMAQDFLNDLQLKAQPTPVETSLEAPTVSDKGPLQQKTLPKVVDIGQPPEKIATPEAIKKPSPTPTPSP